MNKLIVSKEQLDHLTNIIIKKLHGNVKLSKETIDKISKEIDLKPIIKAVVNILPVPKDGINGIKGEAGKDADITEDIISGIVVKVIDQIQKIFKVPANGIDGRQGESGVQGLPGRDGLNGVQGPRGETGAQGSQGIRGKIGLPGVVGRIGLPGKAGPIGLTGESGEDGVFSDDDILKVIEALDLSKHVTQKDLDDLIKNLLKDLALGKHELPTQELGGGLDGPQLINEISRVLKQSDWINGLPGDGTLPANLNYIDLTDEPTGVPEGTGVLSWNKGEISLDIQTGIGPTLQVGQETYILIYNDLAAPITNGTLLRPKAAALVGALIVPTVEKTNASVFSTVEGTIMMATMAIPVGTVGLATRFGRVRGIDTDGETPGASVYAGITDGTFTTTKPEFPNYAISIGGIIKSDLTDGEIFVSVTRDFSDTVLNFWNGVFRESFDFLVTSAGGVITGSLSPSNGHPDMTMMFSDGFTMLATTPAKTIALTAGTDTNPQQNFVYILKSTKALTISTSDWPTTEHIKVATVVLKTAATTLSDGVLKNHNWNDHIEDTFTFQGHLSHMTEKLRQFEAQWKSGVQGSAAGFPSNFYVSSTAGVIYQLHKQTFPAQSMPTNDIEVVNNFAAAYTTTNNLNTQTLDALGVTLANSSFSFVVWGVQNKSGEQSHLMCNLPTGKYAKNAPANAVSDALNYSVYDIPNIFQGTGFLIARFTMVLEADGTTWTLHDTEDLRGKLPNTTAGGGGGGAGVTEWTGLTDTPNAYTNLAGFRPQVNIGETALELVNPNLLASGFSATRNGSNQSIPTSTETTLIFDLEEYDINGEYDNTTGIFTCGAANTIVRQVCGGADINHNPGGAIELRMYKNSILVASEKKTPTTAGTTQFNIACSVTTTDTDTITLRVFQITGQIASLLLSSVSRFTVSKGGELP